MSDKKKTTFGAKQHKDWDGLVRGREVAAAWVKIDENGDENISVRVKLTSWEEINFILKKNHRKTGKLQPDYTARTMIWRKN